jgi:hypothetical protein
MVVVGYMKHQNKTVKYIQMNVTCYGNRFPNTKYYPSKDDDLDFRSLREDDGFWFGIDLDGDIPINVHLFFFERRWNTNCEYCELDKDGEWNHYFDSNIYCDNVKVKYIR